MKTEDSLKKSLYKLRWKAYEVLYSICWNVFGNMPITWDVKSLRNKAFFAYTLYRE